MAGARLSKGGRRLASCALAGVRVCVAVAEPPSSAAATREQTNPIKSGSKQGGGGPPVLCSGWVSARMRQSSQPQTKGFIRTYTHTQPHDAQRQRRLLALIQRAKDEGGKTKMHGRRRTQSKASKSVTHVHAALDIGRTRSAPWLYCLKGAPLAAECAAAALQPHHGWLGWSLSQRSPSLTNQHPPTRTGAPPKPSQPASHAQTLGPYAPPAGCCFLLWLLISNTLMST